MWDMMYFKHLYFFDGQDVAFMCTSFKGLPPGSVVSLFMYNSYTRLVEACLHPLWSILQYADKKNISNKNKEIFYYSKKFPYFPIGRQWIFMNRFRQFIGNKL
jgi:hypothetical protein